MGAVDVGDKVGVEAAVVRGEGQSDHGRAQIGAADADIDDIGDLLAGVALPFAGDDFVAELLHLGLDFLDLRHDVFAVDQNRFAGEVAQRGVQHGAALGAVDLLAGEHRLDVVLELGFLGKLEQQREGLLADDVLGEVDQDVAVAGGQVELGEAILVFLEKLFKGAVLGVLVVLGELLPCLGRGGVDIVEHEVVSAFLYLYCGAPKGRAVRMRTRQAASAKGSGPDFQQ